MAIPGTAKAFVQPMDPTDQVDYQLDLGGDGGLLDDNELVSSYTLSLFPEAALKGVKIEDTAPYAPALLGGGASIRLWFSVDPTLREDAAYADGLNAAVTLTITTTSNPPRRRQRTFIVRIQQL